jgi:ParB-like chromosome segregation protein Spo0J
MGLAGDLPGGPGWTGRGQRRAAHGAAAGGQLVVAASGPGAGVIGSGAAAIHVVPLGSLRGSHSPRLNGEDLLHVQVLAQAQAPLPPILVQRGSMRVIDGMHRLRAAQLLGRTTIDVQFFDGEDADALVVAVQANTEHGLPLTLADRLAAGERIIELLPQRSDRWIAGVTGLAPATVGTIRRRSQASPHPAGTRTGRDGRERPVDMIERRRLAANAIIRHPDASLRVIARMAGISPGTVRDVRQRVLRGEDPVQRRQPASGGPGQQPVPRQRDGQAVARDRGTLLHDLRRDPSLRLTERGRELLEWLTARAAGPGGLDDLISGVPEHCVYLVARLARQCAAEWHEAACLLEARLEGR